MPQQHFSAMAMEDPDAIVESTAGFRQYLNSQWERDYV